MNITRRLFVGALLCFLIPLANGAVIVRQELIAGLSSAATTVAVTFTTTPVLSGSCLDVFVLNNSGNGTTTVSDSASNTYTQVGATITGSTRNLRQFVACNVVGGALTVTATQVDSQDQFLIDAREISGTSGLDSGTGTPAGQYQAAPGTGTNAITTGSGAGNLTPTTQPGLISGFLALANPGSANSAGTGFVQGVSELAPGGFLSNYVISESVRYTSTAAIPATFSTNYAPATSLTLAALFIELPAAPGALGNQVPFNQWTSISASATATWTEPNILCNATAGAVTITLPSAAGGIGNQGSITQFEVEKTDSSGNACNVVAPGSQTVRGVSPFPITTQYAPQHFRSDGANWW